MLCWLSVVERLDHRVRSTSGGVSMKAGDSVVLG